MINEYSRTELLIGSENMEKLKKASVAVFGVGGVGSHCIEALARCGIGRLILIDNDDVSLIIGIFRSPASSARTIFALTVSIASII